MCLIDKNYKLQKIIPNGAFFQKLRHFIGGVQGGHEKIPGTYGGVGGCPKCLFWDFFRPILGFFLQLFALFLLFFSILASKFGSYRKKGSLLAFSEVIYLIGTNFRADKFSRTSSARKLEIFARIYYRAPSTKIQNSVLIFAQFRANCWLK